MIEPTNEAAPQDTLLQREAPEPGESRTALVQRWLKDIATARAHWKPDFDRMRRNMKMAGGKQWPGQGPNDQRYKVNLIQRVLKTTVASLYAKNPTVIYKRRPTLDFQLWDGTAESALMAQQTMEMAAQLEADDAAMVQPEATSILAQAAQARMLLQDIQQGVARRQMIDRIGKTLVVLMNYYMGECQPGFKKQMKQMIRRCRTTAVGYVKLGFQREMDLSETQRTKLADHAEKLAAIGRLQADLADGELDPHAAEVEELRLAIAAIKSEPERIIREGLVWDFPKSTSLIPSISTEKLTGWVGCDWLAEEIMLSPDRVKEVYGVDIGKNYTAYRTVGGSPEGGDVRKAGEGAQNTLARIYHVYDKTTGLQLVVCEGYNDFLKEPSSPDVFIEQFFPYFAITFNDVEDEGRLFPDSDVENLTHPQKEFNRSKEAVRQHRIANRPLYLTPKGTFEEDEVVSLTKYAAHDVIEVNSLEKGRPATDLLAPVQKIGIDPNLYETNSIFEDMQRVTGASEANMGGTAGATATENSIAESSRQGSIGLDSDDLDELLTDVFRAGGSVLLSELDEQTVKKIAGVGAVWPTLSRDEIAAELFLEVKGGSSGRPNAAAEAAKFERVAPTLLQIPGVTPRFLAEKAIQLLDADVDMEEAISEGLPSIAAQNAVRQMPTGDPSTDPASQGANGSQPPKAKKARDNGQPGHTQPGENS